MAGLGVARRILSQPAVRFIVLGGLIFAAYAAWGEPSDPPVRLADAPRESLFESFTLEHGRPPGPAERRALLERWAQDEALLRHAYALRLHEADRVVRRRLIQDVEFLLEADAEPVTEVDLRARYLRDPERFVMPARRSFDHVFVAGGDPDMRSRAEALREALRGGAEPSSRGQPSSLGPRLEGVTRRKLAARLNEPLARAAFELPVGEWSEPLPSPLGLHLLRATEEKPPSRRPFEEVRDQLARELAEEARAEALVQGRQRLRERYVRGAP